jgi:tRNA pseudouridine55 synthase
MQGRRHGNGRDIAGILLLDKPVGITSNTALQRVKRLYRANKAGHTGSLDPLADGLLPVCLGDATKISAFLLDADKHYRVRLTLGVVTTTADREGAVVATRPVPELERSQIERLLDRFTGQIQQLPPMYSALKHQGERLYALARKGIEVDREPREVTIFALTLVDFAPPELEFDVHCTKGTYVRTLAEDIGEALACGAHVIALRRTGVGPYGEEAMIGLAELEELESSRGLAALDALLLTLDSALERWPGVRLSKDTAYYLRKGQSVLVPQAPTAGWVRIYGADDTFIGVGMIDEDGKVAPKRLMQGSD